jgi:hypothetical protein
VLARFQCHSKGGAAGDAGDIETRGIAGPNSTAVVTEMPHTATLLDVAKAVAFRGGELSEDTKLVGSAGFVNVVGAGVGMPFL